MVALLRNPSPSHCFIALRTDVPGAELNLLSAMSDMASQLVPLATEPTEQAAEHNHKRHDDRKADKKTLEHDTYPCLRCRVTFDSIC